jgi:hypothetical protein
MYKEKTHKLTGRKEVIKTLKQFILQMKTRGNLMKRTSKKNLAVQLAQKL